MSDVPSIGFACLWDPDPRTTWSYTPWNLRAGMRAAGTADIVDVGLELPPRTRTALKALHVRRRAGRLVTTWHYSRLTDAYCGRALERSAARAGCEAVLQIQDLAPLSVPYFLYQDLSWDALLADDDPEALLNVSPSTMRRRRERQLAIYEQATGILAMSAWFARSLVEHSGLSPDKVHVVRPGLTSGRHTATGISRREGRRTRLLFVGRDFHRKGGDLVVEALTVLRRDVDPAITLTVAGPREWPLRGEPPPGVEFAGPLPTAEIARLYDSHDLFVMPSRMEPFGIVFAEALSRGLPCVGRDAYAMPELITPGVNGGLVRGDDATDLAKVIAEVLGDDAVYHECGERARETAEWFSWERAGQEAISAISRNP
ncbi:MAG: hypothetical protein JWN52_88 [Actinomycetia bacterium]|nr:hypothetical protein [Actinomycetes bacterium]